MLEWVKNFINLSLFFSRFLWINRCNSTNLLHISRFFFSALFFILFFRVNGGSLTHSGQCTARKFSSDGRIKERNYSLIVQQSCSIIKQNWTIWRIIFSLRVMVVILLMSGPYSVSLVDLTSVLLKYCCMFLPLHPSRWYSRHDIILYSFGASLVACRKLYISERGRYRRPLIWPISNGLGEALTAQAHSLDAPKK